MYSLVSGCGSKLFEWPSRTHTYTHTHTHTHIPIYIYLYKVRLINCHYLSYQFYVFTSCCKTSQLNFFNRKSFWTIVFVFIVFFSQRFGRCILRPSSVVPCLSGNRNDSTWEILFKFWLKMISQIQSFICLDKQGTLEEGRGTQQPKRCEKSNKDKENSPKTLTDKNHQALSQKFRQLIDSWAFYMGKVAQWLNLLLQKYKWPTLLIDIHSRMLYDEDFWSQSEDSAEDLKSVGWFQWW